MVRVYLSVITICQETIEMIVKNDSPTVCGTPLTTNEFLRYNNIGNLYLNWQCTM